MTRGEIRKRVRGYIGTLATNPNLRDNDDFFAHGFVNSLEAVQLVLFLEQEFSLTIAERDRRLDNFHTVDAIVDYVASRMR